MPTGGLLSGIATERSKEASVFHSMEGWRIELFAAGLSFPFTETRAIWLMSVCLSTYDSARARENARTHAEIVKYLY